MKIGGMLTPPRSTHRPHSSSKPGGQVRIVGGSLRNSRLPVFEREGLRPTPDRVRETLFNWLAPVIEGARCMDLYAGSGALGIEAASRGASAVELIEVDAALAANLRAQVERLGIAERVRVHQMRTESWLAQDSQNPFDVVFIDPPYEACLWEAAFKGLAGKPWLARHARVYVEWPAGERPLAPDGFAWLRESRAGAVGFGLLQPFETG